MNFSASDRNAATEAFDKAQKRHAPFVIIFGALVGLWLSGASWLAFPIAIGVAALYAGLFIVGARIFRTVGLKLVERLRNR